MSTPTPADLLQLALGVFPPLPTIVEVLSADGGGFALRIADREDELLHAYGPRAQMRKELQLLARITDPSRGRYEVEFEVAEVFYHSAADALMHLTVTGVHHRKMRRASPRVAVSERAHARVLFCRTLPRDSRLDLRLADISATGVAFTGMGQLDPGDLLLVSTRIGGQAIHFEARVVRSDAGALRPLPHRLRDHRVRGRRPREHHRDGRCRRPRTGPRTSAGPTPPRRWCATPSRGCSAASSGPEPLPRITPTGDRRPARRIPIVGVGVHLAMCTASHERGRGEGLRQSAWKRGVRAQLRRHGRRHARARLGCSC